MIFKFGRAGPRDLADRVPAQVEVPGYLSGRLLVSTMGCARSCASSPPSASPHTLHGV